MKQQKDRDGNLIEVGDLIIRANHGNIDKHIVLGFTENGIYLSNTYRIANSYVGGQYAFTLNNSDINVHNYRHYVRLWRDKACNLLILQKKFIEVTPEVLSKYKTRAQLNEEIKK